MKILFHICCGNCALFPVKLSRSGGHDFTGFWYNPNIHPFEEYMLRLDSLKKLADEWRIDMFYTDEYKPEEFFESIKSPLTPLLQRGEPDIPPLTKGGEGGFFTTFPERCKMCYRLRLEKTAAKARDEGFESFSTTLLISPYQDFEQIIATGKGLADKYNVRFYEKDFRPWFNEALDLSRELRLYRQKYCGCLFSEQEREQAIRAKELSRGKRES
ncbi:MAG: epoxyqueuosine reductase QueH [Nitrospirae bacterium]|nr:epoxyqueuosine reductase QueH [Nitrospirota bacterium]